MKREEVQESVWQEITLHLTLELSILTDNIFETIFHYNLNLVNNNLHVCIEFFIKLPTKIKIKVEL